jgi:hypothetical protein
MSMNDFIHYLQTRPDHTKRTIIVGVSALMIMGMGTLWAQSLQRQFAMQDQQAEGGEVAGSILVSEHRIRIEGKEEKNGKTLIYFRLTNETSDIINFSSNGKITFQSGNEYVSPEKVTDRQGQEFVKKVLSKSTEYGVLVFPGLDEARGTLTFDGLYFEQDPTKVFMEQHRIDLDQLRPLQELRS